MLHDKEIGKLAFRLARDTCSKSWRGRLAFLAHPAGRCPPVDYSFEHGSHPASFQR